MVAPATGQNIISHLNVLLYHKPYTAIMSNRNLTPCVSAALERRVDGQPYGYKINIQYMSDHRTYILIPCEYVTEAL